MAVVAAVAAGSGAAVAVAAGSAAAAVVVVVVAAVAAAAAAAAGMAEAEAEAAAVVAAVADPDLEPLATAIGRTWALEVLQRLRSADRDIEGGWPGTLGEARARIRAELRRPLAIEVIDALARIAYATARQGWSTVSVPDVEA